MTTQTQQTIQAWIRAARRSNNLDAQIYILRWAIDRLEALGGERPWWARRQLGSIERRLYYARACEGGPLNTEAKGCREDLVALAAGLEEHLRRQPGVRAARLECAGITNHA